MEHFYNNIQGWFTYPNLYKQVVESAPDQAHFVEIGVWKGTSAAYLAVEIANSGKQIKFDCIDTWNGSSEHINPTSPTFEPNLVEDPNWLYNTFVNNMEPVKDYYTAYRLPSLEAAQQYKDNSLDFVFIDADHSYESVLADIKAWYPKTSGTIAGHDYSWSGEVQKAVHEFFDPKGLEILETEGCWVVSKK